MAVIGSYTVDCGICDTTVDLPVTTTLVNGCGYELEHLDTAPE